MTKTISKAKALEAATRYAKAHGGADMTPQEKSWAHRIANRWRHPATDEIAPVVFQYAR